jgi:hypothetical protein
MKLISMTEFVLDQGNPSNTDFQFADKVMSYANFLKQPLELWMFVPCDEEGNVLEEPRPQDGDDGNWNYQARFNQYQQAKERCLFFSQHGENEIFDPCLAKVFLDEFYNIEQLSNEIRNIKLTKTAIKQIGL